MSDGQVRGIVKLKKRREFKTVYRLGRPVVTLNTVMLYRKNNLPYNRVGFSINKRKGNSVKRNRWRRLYWEVIRQYNESLKQGYDIVFIARKPAVNLKYKDVQMDLDKLLKKGKLKENIKK